jgi:hypothetical protein
MRLPPDPIAWRASEDLMFHGVAADTHSDACARRRRPRRVHEPGNPDLDLSDSD